CLNSDGDESYTFTSEDGVQYYIYVGIQGNESHEIGDFEIEIDCSSCPPVELLNFQDHSDREIRIGWSYEPGFTDWEVKYGSKGFDPASEGSTVPASAVYEGYGNQGFYNLLLTGLTPNTDYDIAIRADCGEAQGEWVTINS